MTITYYDGLGRLLTPSEVDGNFTDLDARTETAWHSVAVQPSVLYGVPSTPELEVWQGGLNAWAYYPDQTMEAYANFSLPYDWAPGTAVRFGITWAVGNTTATGNVRFRRESSFGTPGSAFSTAALSGGQAAAVDGTPYKCYQLFSQVEFYDSSWQPNTVLVNRFFRDGTNVLDTFEDKIYILNILFFYRRNKFGQPDYQSPYI
jgi:hypothetical protein